MSIPERRFSPRTDDFATPGNGPAPGGSGTLGELEEAASLPARLELAAARLRDVLQITADAFWETDADLRFTHVTQRADAGTADPAGLLGRTPMEAFGSPEDPGWRRHQEDLEARRPVRFEFATRQPDEPRRWLCVGGVPVIGPDGQFRGYRGIATNITARVEAERLAERQHDLLKLATDAIGHGIAIFDPEDRLYLTNVPFRRLLTLDEAHYRPGTHIRTLWLQAVLQGVFVQARGHERTWFERLAAPDPPGRAPRRLETRIEGGRWISIGRSLFANGWKAVVIVDITEPRRREEALRESERRFRELSEASFEGVVMHDRGRVIDANPAFLTLVGRRFDDVLGADLDSVLGSTSLSQVQRAVAHRDASAAAEVEMTRPDGTRFPAEVRTRNLPYEGRAIQVLAIRDITERKTIEARIRQMAEHDPLTGLPNRALFQDRLQQGLAQSRRSGKPLAVLQLDLDLFKSVNDMLGHPAGDHLLKVVAERLAGCVRESDTVARLGGDEFAILLNGLALPQDAEVLAQKIVAALEQPVDYQGQWIHTGTSIGITLFPADHQDPGELLKNADIALYDAKQQGRSTYRFFAPEMRTEIERRRQLEAELRRAIEKREFTLLYQPQFALRSGAPVGVEALLRWRHPERGLLAPDAFLEVAEETGLIVPIGLGAMRAACLEAKGWQDGGLSFGRLAINLAAPELKGARLDQTLATLLAETGLSAEHLQIEIAEPVFLERGLSAVAETLKQVAALGVEVVLDDFGTGCASLAHLKHFELHRLKIDGSFIREIGRSAQETAIVRTIVSLGRSLGLRVVAEGVETQAQADFLRAEGCDAGQGYFWGRPLPAAEIRNLLMSLSRSAAPGAVP